MVAAVKDAVPPTRAEFHRAIASRNDRWFAACLKITGDRALAEDAVQDALVSAWIKRHQYRKSSALSTWIHRIAVNAALQIIRQRRPAAFEPLDYDVPDNASSPVEDLHTRDLDRSLKGAFASLTDIERICFVMKHLEQWRIREIAESMDLTEGTVKQAVFRALKKLRTQITDRRELTG